MRTIGGYFELELRYINSEYRFCHSPSLNSGRHALEYILLQLDRTPDHIYLPYYTCEVILEPIKRLGLTYSFYHINENLEIDTLPILGQNEYIIANNYFGIKDAYIDRLVQHYKSQIIVDNAQAFFHSNHLDMKAIYSPRKFFGVPDGGIAWTTVTKDIPLERDHSLDRFTHLLQRIDIGPEAGYEEFKKNDALISFEPLKKMSTLTSRILSTINYNEIIKKRRSNFEILNQTLGSLNKLNLPNSHSYACPMVYPFQTSDKNLKQKLIDNYIYIATYWPNVYDWCNKDSVEYLLAESILPLPIDQRYDELDMNRIIMSIMSNL